MNVAVEDELANTLNFGAAPPEPSHWSSRAARWGGEERFAKPRFGIV